MKKSNILTKMMSPGIYTTEIDKSTSKTYWFPFKRKQKLNKIMDKLNGK
jgi:putative IMPACT (imprinted ancient) family translation regulator